jgi:peptidoglycan hydrolase CwlO-like protein
MVQWAPVIAALIVTIGGFAGGLWSYRKNRSDAAEKLIQSAMNIVAQKEKDLTKCEEDKKQFEKKLQEIMDRATAAEKKAEDLEELVKDLKRQVDQLEKQLSKFKSRKGERQNGSKT